MPVIWILVVGTLLYLALRMLENHHSATHKKQKPDQPRNIQETAATVDAMPASDENEVAAPLDTTPEPEKGIEKIPFIDTMAGLPNETKAELRQLKLTTPRAISDTTDEKLLEIKGLGPARLKQIRAACADAKDPESEFVVVPAAT